MNPFGEVLALIVGVAIGYFVGHWVGSNDAVKKCIAVTSKAQDQSVIKQESAIIKYNTQVITKEVPVIKYKYRTIKQYVIKHESAIDSNCTIDAFKANAIIGAINNESMATGD